MPDSDMKVYLDRPRTAPTFVRVPEKTNAHSDPQSRIPGYAPRPNRKAIKRKRSTFQIVLVLFGCGLGIVLYIGNILQVNQTALEVGRLQTEYARLQNANALLKAEIDRKSGWERINKIANERLGLRYPTRQPVWIEVDEERLESIVATPLKKERQ